MSRADEVNCRLTTRRIRVRISGKNIRAFLITISGRFCASHGTIILLFPKLIGREDVTDFSLTSTKPFLTFGSWYEYLLTRPTENRRRRICLIYAL